MEQLKRKINRLRLLTLALTVIILLLSGYSCKNQKKIESAIIKYVDFILMTDVNVDCQRFESTFIDKYSIIEVKDPDKLNKLQGFVNQFRYDTLTMNIDTRAKLLIFYSNNIVDTICISNHRIYYNNNPVLYDLNFINYIKELINEKKIP